MSIARNTFPTTLRHVIAVAVVLAGDWQCRAAPASKDTRPRAGQPDVVLLGPNSPQLAFIGTDTVAPRRERTVAVLPAQLTLDEDHTVRVVSPVTGRALSVDVHPGDVVKAGAALARLTSVDLAQARSDVAKARAALEQATATLARTRDLFEHHVVAEKDVAQARTDEAQARAEALRAEARVRGLGDDGTDIQGAYVLRAPISGIVVDRSVSVGTEVRSDAATPLFTISALDTLWMTANVPQRDLPNVRPGVHLDFTTDAVPGRHFAAVVTYVSNALDPVTRTATVRAKLENVQRVLRAQTAGTALLTASSTLPFLAVPTAALVTQDTGTVVFVEEAPGRYVRRSVQVTQDDGTLATISRGVQAGDHVVTRGSLLLAAEAKRLR